MEMDRKSWISQRCTVIILGRDGAQQLHYAHPSQTKIFHMFLTFLYIWKMRISVVQWIHHANYFDIPKICPEIFQLIQCREDKVKELEGQLTINSDPVKHSS